MANSSNSITHMEYISRINKVQDYIEANLGGDLSLDTLADISGFSKFHFHRIFRGVVKEILLSYINRTRQDNLKTSICLVISEDVAADGEIGKMSIPSGKYAIGHFVLDDPIDHTNAWNYIYGEWLPNSGFQPDEGYVFEMYMNYPSTHPEKKHFLDIYIPIKPL